MSLDLEPIKKRCEEATPGPWRKTADVLRGGGCVSTRFDDLFVSYAMPPTIQTSRDCDFIAHSREDVPALIAEVERLRSGQDEIIEIPGLANAVLVNDPTITIARYAQELDTLRKRLEAAERIVRCARDYRVRECEFPDDLGYRAEMAAELDGLIASYYEAKE